MDLPTFRYHADPVATGSIEESDNPCACCGRSRGYIYTGPVYAVEELDEAICPWCIASGDAHTKFDAEFVDAAGVGDHGAWEQVPRAVIEEVRTERQGSPAGSRNAGGRIAVTQRSSSAEPAHRR